MKKITLWDLKPQKQHGCKRHLSYYKHNLSAVKRNGISLEKNVICHVYKAVKKM